MFKDLSSAVSAEHSEWLDLAEVTRRWLFGSKILGSRILKLLLFQSWTFLREGKKIAVRLA